MAQVERAPQIHGVLVTFRRPELLAHVLGVLAAQTRPLDRLVVVDNAPTEANRATVARLAPDAEYVAAPDNLGPAGGLALGMERLLPVVDGGDWIVTLDDDDPPPFPTLLASLVAFASDITDRDRSVGAVGADGARCDRRRGQMVWVPDEMLRGDVDVDAIGGDFFPCYSVAALREVGTIRAELFFGFEELELGLRLKDAGYRLVVQGALCRTWREATDQLDLTVEPSRALGPLTWRRYYSLRNLVRVLLDRGSWAAAVRVSLVVGLAKPLANLLRSPRTATAHLASNVRALRDAWTGRLGRRVEPVS